MSSATWTPEEDAELTQLATGTPRMYYADIGRQMGKTKGSIIGRAHRLGLPARTTGPHGGRPKRIGPPSVRIRHYHAKAKAKRPAPPPGTITVFELEPDQCRWPYGEENFTFCANEVEPGRSYCEGHCQLAYRRTPEITEKAQARMSRYGNWSARATD